MVQPAVSIGSFIDAHLSSQPYMREQYGRAIADAQRIMREAEAAAQGREIVARLVLFSGGNDSTVLAHLMRHAATGALHADTTIGIERTRAFVRATCEAWGLDLIERRAPQPFDELVLNVWRGMPGPSSHGRAFDRLKGRVFEAVRRELIERPTRQRVLFIAGRRRRESARRSTVPEIDVRGSIIWASPLANWAADDMRIYRAMHPDVPRNPVSEALGMSGECCCGAFAEPGELERIRAVDAATAEHIESIERRAREAQLPAERCSWGWGATRLDPRGSSRGYLCDSCHDPLAGLVV